MYVAGTVGGGPRKDAIDNRDSGAFRGFVELIGIRRQRVAGAASAGAILAPIAARAAIDEWLLDDDLFNVLFELVRNAGASVVPIEGRRNLVFERHDGANLTAGCKTQIVCRLQVLGRGHRDRERGPDF